jgi:hypothetical protein
MKNISQQTRRKMSESAKKRCTPAWRKAKSQEYSTPLPKQIVERLYNSGATQSEIGKFLGVSQKVVWGFMKRNGIKSRVAAKRNQSGDKNSSWKGDDACYSAFHLRVQSARGKPACCEHCGTTVAENYDWANLTGNYQDVSDYIRLCRSCHWKMDGTINNINHMKERLSRNGE